MKRAITFEDFQKMPVMPLYVPRFLTAEQYAEAINFYHLARAAGKHTRHERMVWSAGEIAKKYGVGETAAYKDISSGLEGY